MNSQPRSTPSSIGTSLLATARFCTTLHEGAALTYLHNANLQPELYRSL